MISGRCYRNALILYTVQPGTWNLNLDCAIGKLASQGLLGLPRFCPKVVSKSHNHICETLVFVSATGGPAFLAETGNSRCSTRTVNVLRSQKWDDCQAGAKYLCPESL